MFRLTGSWRQNEASSRGGREWRSTSNNQQPQPLHTTAAAPAPPAPLPQQLAERPPEPAAATGPPAEGPSSREMARLSARDDAGARAGGAADDSTKPGTHAAEASAAGSAPAAAPLGAADAAARLAWVRKSSRLLACCDTRSCDLMCANDVFFRVPVGMCLRSRLRAVLGRTPLKRPAAQALKRPARALEAKGGSARATADKGKGAARLKKPGCSKCRYATYGCSKCAPDLPRRKRKA